MTQTTPPSYTAFEDTPPSRGEAGEGGESDSTRIPIYDDRACDRPLEDIPYDKIATAWVYKKRVVEGCDLQEQAFALHPIDRFQSEKLRLKVTAISALLAFLLIITMIIGAAALHREFGPFTVSNILASLLFCVGVLQYWLRGSALETRITLAQVYFLLTVAMTMVSVGLSIIYIATVNSRVAKFCQDQGCDQHHESEYRRNLYIGSSLGVFFLFWLLSYLAHISFLYLIALQRVAAMTSPPDPTAADTGPGALTTLVRAVGLVVPNWGGVARWLDCHLWHPCSHACHRCFHGCSHKCCTSDCVVTSFVVVIVVIFLVCLVLCFAYNDQPVGDISCAIVELMIEIVGN